MPEMTQQAGQDRLRAQLVKLARLDWDISPAFGAALRACLTAMDSQDPALMRPHLNGALEALRDLARDSIRKRLGRPQLFRETWQEMWEVLKKYPLESYDDVGKEFEAVFNEQLESLLSLRDGPVKSLQEHGYEVENALQLEQDIKELQQLKQAIFEDWPWSERALPPVNRKMVAESRAAIARGERGERIEDLIQRLGGNPTANR